MNYLYELWNAICGRGVVVSPDVIDEKLAMQRRLNDLESLTTTQSVRIARYERRAEAQRKARANRQPKEIAT